MSDEPLARHTDPETSHEAKHFDPTEVERKILDSIANHCEIGMTCYEVVQETGLPVQTVSPRFKPLHTKGFLEYHTNIDNQLLKRPGGSGPNQPIHFLNYRQSS